MIGMPKAPFVFLFFPWLFETVFLYVALTVLKFIL